MDENPDMKGIKERDKYQYEKMGGPDLQCQADRHALLAEVERLKAENKELQEEVKRQKEMVFEAEQGEDL